MGRGRAAPAALRRLCRLIGTALRSAAFSASPSDGGHVSPIPTHHFAALSTGLSSFVRGELVSGAFLVGGTSALASDFALLFPVHRCEATILSRFVHCFLLRLKSAIGADGSQTASPESCCFFI